MVKEFKATGSAIGQFKSFNQAKKALNQRVGLQTPLTFGHKYDNQILQAKKIFEIGCGLGRNLEWIMKNTKAKYYAIEPNPAVIKYFWEYENNLEYKERVYLSSSFDEEIKKHKFDIVVCMFVFQHISYRHNKGSDKNAMDIDEITHEILPMTNSNTIWLLAEHESEEANWQAKWIMNNGFTLLQEFVDKEVYNFSGGHKILLLKNENIF